MALSSSLVKQTSKTFLVALSLGLSVSAATSALAETPMLQPLSQIALAPKATPKAKPVAKTVKPASNPKAATPAANTSKTLSGSASKTVQEFQTAKKFDVIRSVPLDISGYPDAGFPSSFTSADQVVAILNNKRNLLLHMEAIRRAYHDLPPSEQQELADQLFDRYRMADDDSYRFFDHGYAQLVINNNKTGLFFLRKANDAIKSQFSSLAYGAAQVEADLNFENGTPEDMTQRKVDAIFRLKDAINRDAEKHQPGFWISFIRIIDKMKPLTAYQDFTNSDLSVKYVPYGTISVPAADPKATVANSAPNTCSVLPPFKKEPTEALLQERYIDALGTGKPLKLQAYSTAEPNLYHIVLWDGPQTILDLKAPVSPNVVEDLDGDKQFEVVVRQFDANKEAPVQVYRYNECKFELDKSVDERFH